MRGTVLKPIKRGEISFLLFIRKIVYPSVRVDLRVMSDGERIDTRAVPEAEWTVDTPFKSAGNAFITLYD